jgi:hypothetical protein
MGISHPLLLSGDPHLTAGYPGIPSMEAYMSIQHALAASAPPITMEEISKQPQIEVNEDINIDLGKELQEE